MNGSEYKVTTHLVGSYNIYNALAAATIGKEFNVSEEDIVAALSDYVPSNNRSQFTETANNKLVVDTYNANPTSMMAALENFTLMSAPNKMAILGEMRELGSISAEEHQRVADFLKSHGINDVWLVGAGFTDTVCNFRKFPDSTAVKAELAANPIKGKCILIKGSNGNRLFELPELL
jgi:UDP-N-acetylmuramoyl-tripeptide--D-alanyl-D-alanine ligase